MIQTIPEYKSAEALTWLELANRFGATSYQEAQQWKNNGWYVITHKGGEELVSPRRKRVKL